MGKIGAIVQIAGKANVAQRTGAGVTIEVIKFALRSGAYDLARLLRRNPSCEHAAGIERVNELACSALWVTDIVDDHIRVQLLQPGYVNGIDAQRL